MSTILRSLLLTAGTAQALCCCYQGLIHSLTQGQRGKGREQWRKAGGAVEAGGEWDSQ